MSEVTPRSTKSSLPPQPLPVPSTWNTNNNSSEDAGTPAFESWRSTRGNNNTGRGLPPPTPLTQEEIKRLERKDAFLKQGTQQSPMHSNDEMWLKIKEEIKRKENNNQNNNNNSEAVVDGVPS